MSNPRLPELKLSLLGPTKIECNGTAVELSRRKTLALLAFLAKTGQPQRRDTLASMLWPESGQSLARAALRRALYGLNAALGEGVLQTSQEVIELVGGPHLWLDVAQFEFLLAQANEAAHQSTQIQLLTNAVALYQGDFLGDFTLVDCPDFNEWLRLQADGLKQNCGEALAILVDQLKETHEFDAAITHARHWLTLDETHEPVHQELMQLFAFAGQYAAAIRQYEECKRILEHALNAVPSKQTNQLYRSIRARKLSAPKSTARSATQYTAESPTTSHQPPATNDRPPPHNLPPQPAAFVGREVDLRNVQNLLLNEHECRLLTLLGPGGIGKTRLSLQVGQLMVDGEGAARDEFRAASAYPDGVFFVRLASVDAVENIVSAVADALGFPLQGTDEPLAQLLNYLSAKRLLLIIDNIEHLLAGTEILLEMLGSAPNIKLLLTSREALGMSEEWLYPLGGLSFPLENSEQIEQSEDISFDAIDLFVQCARRMQQNFSLKEERDHVVRICHLVDGVPLALELAATWLRVLPINEIADEIERGLDILTAEHRNIPERHRSMRVVCEQSWRYLDAQEQETLRRLSIFRGGFQRDAAVKVAGTSLSVLASLLDKSFLRRSDERYHMHELIRQFASEQLHERGEPSKIQEAHANHYLAMMAAKDIALRGADPAAVSRLLRAELDNLRQAWLYAVETDMIDLLYDCFETMAYFYEFAGLLSECQQVFTDGADLLARMKGSTGSERHNNLIGHFLIKSLYCSGYLNNAQAVEALEARICTILPHCTDPLCRVGYLSAAGLCDFMAGRIEEALTAYQEALPLYRRWGTHYQLAAHLQIMGETLARLGKLDESEAILQEALELSTIHDDTRGQARTISHMGVLAFVREDFQQAYRHFSTAVALFDEMGDFWRAERTENNVGFSLLHLEQYDDALQASLRALNLREKFTASAKKGYIYDTLGQLYFALEDWAQARQYHEYALAEAQANEIENYAIDALICLAKVDIAEGLFGEARERLEQASTRLADAPSPFQHAWVNEVSGDLCAAIGKNEDALQQYDNAVAQYASADNRHGRCYVLLSKGRLLLVLQKEDEAGAVLEEALGLAQEVGRQSVIEQTRRLLHVEQEPPRIYDQ